MRDTSSRAIAQELSAPAPITFRSQAEKYSNDTPAQRAKRAEIKLRYQRNRTERGSAKVYVRFSDLEKLFEDRHGAHLPDDAVGRDCLFIMANHLAYRADPVRRILEWVQLWAPWHDDAETEALIGQVMRRPKKWRADPLAELLGLDYATRTRLRITTIGATDCKKQKRASLRRKKDAARRRVLRAKAGAAPRALAVSQVQPWKAEGISRRTWYRRRSLGAVAQGG